MQNKTELFQKLKPTCVALSQAAASLDKQTGALQSVTDHLENLKQILAIATLKPCALDAKLAEYVFFPISHVLRASQRASVRCLELSLQCVAILIEQGWRNDLSAQLAAQIVILCTLLGEKNPKGLSFSENTDELQSSAFKCLRNLFASARYGSDSQKALTSDSNFPQLGQTISVLLDGIHDGAAPEVQLAATDALERLMTNVAGKNIHASFLPGTVSKLTKVLTPRTQMRRNHLVLVGCLRILTVLLSSTMSGDAISSPNSQSEKASKEKSDHSAKGTVDAQWQETAATQLKPALISVMKLRSHSREDVKQALAKLCLLLLRTCGKSLSNCSQPALEALLDMSSEHGGQALAIELEMLLYADASVLALLQTMLYDSLQSLSVTLQGADEQAKSANLQQIRTAYDILVKCEATTSTLERKMAGTLSESVVVTIGDPKPKAQKSNTSQIKSLDLQVLSDKQLTTSFSSPLIQYKGQEEVLHSIERLTQAIGISKPAGFVTDLMRALRQSHGDSQIANFWLLVTASQSALQQKSSLSDLLNVEDQSAQACEHCLEELHATSILILMDPSGEPQDPRLQALALRSLALRAQFTGKEFRYELVDALYPVLHTMATPDEKLQQDSIVTLNAFKSACEYASVKDLIVDNVDYLTNAVALKLNAFDVSPQAPQVLLMMVRLAGPSLLPYLDDTIDSIFAALEDYHGYPLLVELLFKVLSVVAQVGAKAPQLAIEQQEVDESIVAIQKDGWRPINTHKLPALLRQRQEDETELQRGRDEELEAHPKEPWGPPKEAADEDDEDEGDAEDAVAQQLDETESSPPAPKAYKLLFKITELTQHYLPSASPSLRTSLLGLIRTTVPAIAKHQNSFLPLINTLWPEIVSRLDDDERQVIASGLEIVSVLCQHAGDFMRTRTLQLWPKLVDLYRECAREMVQSHLASGTLASQPKDKSSSLVPSTAQIAKSVSRMQVEQAYYHDTTTRAMWSALTTALTTAVKTTKLPPEKFDEALEMLEPMTSDSKTLKALEQENADAVWLSGVKSGRVTRPAVPQRPEGALWHFAQCAA